MKKVKLNDENIHKGYLILINPDNLLKTNEIKLISYSEKYKNIELDQVANSQLQKALKSINANDEIVPISGVRTFEEQKRLYTDSIIENGEEYTKKFVALPNASEHQTGLAIDLALNKPNIDFICPSFPYNGICQEFRKIAPNFGFIERYKDEKKNITKIAKEEWHFRFVGYPHSKIITNKDLCLEEYIEYLYEKLKTGTYIHGKYSAFKVYEPKERIIEKAPYIDRIVHRWVVDNFLIPYYVPSFINTTYACIKGKRNASSYFRFTKSNAKNEKII